MNKNDNTNWWKFIDCLQSFTSQKDMGIFLNLLLTIEEQKIFIDRFLILQELLKNNKTQRQIAVDLQVSIAKITRGSNCLKHVNEDLKNHLIKRL